MENQMKTNKPTRSNDRHCRQPRSNWHYYVVAAVCCLLLVAGFFFAARQHFSSMEYGLQNSSLRRQLEELQSEKRRLLLNREISLTPNELRKAARQFGLEDPSTTMNEPVKAEVAATRKDEAGRPGTANSTTARPINKVIPTVISLPVGKPARADKQASRESPALK